MPVLTILRNRVIKAQAGVQLINFKFITPSIPLLIVLRLPAHQNHEVKENADQHGCFVFDFSVHTQSVVYYMYLKVDEAYLVVCNDNSRWFIFQKLLITLHLDSSSYNYSL